MAAKTIPMSTIKQVLRLFYQGKSRLEISRITGLSRNTVKKYIRLSEEGDFSQNRILGCEDEELELFLSGGKNAEESLRYANLRDQFDYLSSELKRKHVTRKLLWIEYKKGDPDGYEYSQFCYHLQQAQKSKHVSMVMQHEIGDMLFCGFRRLRLGQCMMDKKINPLKSKYLLRFLGIVSMGTYKR